METRLTQCPSSRPLSKALEGRYGLQPVHKPSKIIRPLGPEVRFPFHAPETILFPQHVKPSSAQSIYGTAETVPSFDGLFPFGLA
jgi:hypothetical protein